MFVRILGNVGLSPNTCKPWPNSVNLAGDNTQWCQQIWRLWRRCSRLQEKSWNIMGKSKIGDTAVENTVKRDTSTPTSEKFVSCELQLTECFHLSNAESLAWNCQYICYFNQWLKPPVAVKMLGDLLGAWDQSQACWVGCSQYVHYLDSQGHKNKFECSCFLGLALRRYQILIAWLLYRSWRPPQARFPWQSSCWSLLYPKPHHCWTFSGCPGNLVCTQLGWAATLSRS